MGPSAVVSDAHRTVNDQEKQATAPPALPSTHISLTTFTSPSPQSPTRPSLDDGAVEGRRSGSRALEALDRLVQMEESRVGASSTGPSSEAGNGTVGSHSVGDGASGKGPSMFDGSAVVFGESKTLKRSWVRTGESRVEQSRNSKSPLPTPPPSLTIDPNTNKLNPTPVSGQSGRLSSRSITLLL